MSDPATGFGRILLVGGGNMGGAMARGWVEFGIEPGSIHVVDPNPGPILQPLIANGSLLHSVEVPDGAFEIVVLAVKPQIMATALPALRTAVGPQTLVISIAAGTITSFIASHLGAVAIVRAMPNTPALIGRGITGCFAGSGISDVRRAAAEALLSACGAVVWVESEADIDTVTAVSGSGPAYVFLLAEALAAAGEAAGLPADLAMTLARHTIAGAGEMMLGSDDAPAQLRRNVTSPKGTTEAALAVLMGDAGFGPLLREAVGAAKRRSIELSGT